MLNGSPQRSSKQQVITFNESFIATDEPLSCPSHSYNTYILAHEPLIIYIENFLSESESKHLLEIRYLIPIKIPNKRIFHIRILRSVNHVTDH